MEWVGDEKRREQEKGLVHKIKSNLFKSKYEQKRIMHINLKMYEIIFVCVLKEIGR